ncbi:hypothetical protein Poly30_04410 [Planctomycetes bacterium Poly30]|uniref:Uncharacterized protein n=1 Tax=Saltatorellus ferox TaxID=2528018 RepID=A0A518ELH1_9BACT|nr:hypothetical protein Poly30_04410 [Planctomycetes bacterium Poly30]
MTAKTTNRSDSGGDELTRFGMAMIQLIDEASTNSSYKYALLVALMDAASENVGRGGLERGSVTSRQLAVHVLELYWPQARPWSQRTGSPPERLKAIATSGRSIVDHIVLAIADLPGRVTAAAMREWRPQRWAKLLDETEKILIRYPIAHL